MPRWFRSRSLPAALTAAMITILALPAVSDAAAQPLDVNASTATDGLPDQLLAAMRRDLGLTGEQVTARLAAEDRASRIEHLAAAGLGGAYAGAWFDARLGRLVVATTDAAGVARVRALGADAVVVEHGTARLAEVKRHLDTLAGTAAPPAVTSWHVDPARNAVVLNVDPSRLDATATAFVASARALGPVLVVHGTESPRPAYNVVGGNAFFIGSSRCSIGFSVRTAGGAKAFVTAGHCTAGGGAVYGGNRVRMGSASGSTFGPGGDYGKVSVSNDSWDLRPWVNLWDGRALVVQNADPASVGQSVCRSGSTSGWRCGEIKAKGVTVNYPGRTVNGLVRSSACASPGDSGGPFVHSDHAQGMTSGITNSCGSGGLTDSFYQPVREALNAYNLRLVTG